VESRLRDMHRADVARRQIRPLTGSVGTRRPALPASVAGNRYPGRNGRPVECGLRERAAHTACTDRRHRTGPAGQEPPFLPFLPSGRSPAAGKRPSSPRHHRLPTLPLRSSHLGPDSKGSRAEKRKTWQERQEARCFSRRTTSHSGAPLSRLWRLSESSCLQLSRTIDTTPASPAVGLICGAPRACSRQAYAALRCIGSNSHASFGLLVGVIL